jgi:cobalamin biosynthesis Mg chelatase CobN
MFVYNFPPGPGNVGVALFLDVAASVRSMLEALRDDGLVQTRRVRTTRKSRRVRRKSAATLRLAQQRRHARAQRLLRALSGRYLETSMGGEVVGDWNGGPEKVKNSLLLSQ